MDANLPVVILALIVACQLGIQLDCNRRVRELQRNSDLQMRYFDALTRGTLLGNPMAHTRVPHPGDAQKRR